MKMGGVFDKRKCHVTLFNLTENAIIFGEENAHHKSTAFKTDLEKRVLVCARFPIKIIPTAS